MPGIPYWWLTTGVNQVIRSTLLHATPFKRDHSDAVESSSPTDQQSQVDHASLEIEEDAFIETP